MYKIALLIMICSGLMGNHESYAEMYNPHNGSNKTQFVSIKKAFGKSKGESVNWLKVSNAGAYGGKLAETQTMHEATQPLAWGTVTVDEYGLSIPFTQKVEALSKFDVLDIMRGSLMDDAAKCIDGEIERQFNACLLRYSATATDGYTFSTTATASHNCSSAFNRYHLRKIVTELKKRNVPGLPNAGGDYGSVCSIEAVEQLFADFETATAASESGYQMMLNGEVTKYYGCRIVEDTFATRFVYDSTARTATAISWTGDKSKPAYFFGYPTVREAIVIPEGIRMKVTTDYGRSSVGRPKILSN